MWHKFKKIIVEIIIMSLGLILMPIYGILFVLPGLIVTLIITMILFPDIFMKFIHGGLDFTGMSSLDNAFLSISPLVFAVMIYRTETGKRWTEFIGLIWSDHSFND